MKSLYAISTLILYPIFMFFQTSETTSSVGIFEPVAVIELFSSQGCSSCPAADRLLSKTISDAEKTGENIFALCFHVDYWDRLGWKDPFSNKKFSERQNDYTGKLNLNSNYTPQMIVNGTTEFVGSDAKALDKALSNALKVKSEVAFKNLELRFDEKNNVTVHYELEGDYKNCKINFVLMSVTETTAIKRGENSGLTLVNENIVNQLITDDASENGKITFAPGQVPSKDNLLTVAFIQNISTLKITGAAQVKPGIQYKTTTINKQTIKNQTK